MLPPPALFQGVSMFPVKVGGFLPSLKNFTNCLFIVSISAFVSRGGSIWRASCTLGMGVPGRLSSPQRESSSPSPLPKPHPILDVSTSLCSQPCQGQPPWRITSPALLHVNSPACLTAEQRLCCLTLLESAWLMQEIKTSLSTRAGLLCPPTLGVQQSSSQQPRR